MTWSKRKMQEINASSTHCSWYSH